KPIKVWPYPRRDLWDRASTLRADQPNVEPHVPHLAWSPGWTSFVIIRSAPGVSTRNRPRVAIFFTWRRRRLSLLGRRRFARQRRYAHGVPQDQRTEYDQRPEGHPKPTRAVFAAERMYPRPEP